MDKVDETLSFSESWWGLHVTYQVGTFKSTTQQSIKGRSLRIFSLSKIIFLSASMEKLWPAVIVVWAGAAPVVVWAAPVMVWAAPAVVWTAPVVIWPAPVVMGGELSKREGVLFRSFQSEAKSFSRFFHRFAQIYTLITISLLDIGFKWCFMIFSFVLRGCFLQWEGAPTRSGGAHAPSKPLILHPCLW